MEIRVAQDINNFCSDEQLAEILSELQRSGGVIICTHLDGEQTDEAPEDTLVADTVLTVGTAAAAGVATPAVATAGLTAAGFTSGGVAAGSLAAATQAGIGNVAAGSLFASLQSIGATGGFAILGPVGIGAALLVGGIVAGVTAQQRRARQDERERIVSLRRERERERQERIANGTAQRGIDICERCWIKMQLRDRLQR